MPSRREDAVDVLLRPRAASGRSERSLGDAPAVGTSSVTCSADALLSRARLAARRLHQCLQQAAAVGSRRYAVQGAVTTVRPARVCHRWCPGRADVRALLGVLPSPAVSSSRFPCHP